MSGPLNIVMISDDFVPGATGVGTYLQRVTKELAARGHRVSAITSRRKGEPEIEIWNGVTIYRTFTLKAYGFYQALPGTSRVREIFEAIRPDVIHFHYLSVLLMRAVAASQNLAAKRVYTYHMTIDHLTQPLPMKPLRPLLHALHVRYCNRLDLVLAPSRNLIEQVRTYGITTPMRYLTNPVAFDVAREAQPARRDGTFRVLYVGRLNPEKNLPYLLRGFAQFAQRHPACELSIAGIGDMRASLEALAKELGMSDRIKFLGFVKHADLSPYYSAADVFVLPSLIEAQPMVVIEAMCFGKPVIVTRQMISSRELVEEGGNGYVVDADRVDELARRLEQLATDDALRTAMGAASLRRSSEYGLPVVVSGLESVYAELMSGAFDRRRPAA